MGQPEPAAVAAVLRSAAALLGEHGWCSGRFTDTRGCICALVAIRSARGDRYGAARAAVRVIHRRLHRWDWTDGLCAWNDAPGRTAAEVIDLLHVAAEDVMAHGAA